MELSLVPITVGHRTRSSSIRPERMLNPGRTQNVFKLYTGVVHSSKFRGSLSFSATPCTGSSAGVESLFHLIILASKVPPHIEGMKSLRRDVYRLRMALLSPERSLTGTCVLAFFFQNLLQMKTFNLKMSKIYNGCTIIVPDKISLVEASIPWQDIFQFFSEKHCNGTKRYQACRHGCRVH